jgi:hypothetical protein
VDVDHRHIRGLGAAQAQGIGGAVADRGRVPGVPENGGQGASGLNVILNDQNPTGGLGSRDIMEGQFHRRLLFLRVLGGLKEYTEYRKALMQFNAPSYCIAVALSPD